MPITLDHYLEELQTKPGALPGATARAQAKACGAFNHHDRWVGFNDHGEQILHQEPCHYLHQELDLGLPLRTTNTESSDTKESIPIRR